MPGWVKEVRERVIVLRVCLFDEWEDVGGCCLWVCGMFGGLHRCVWARQTSEDHVHGQEVRADGECDHGECEGEELVDDSATW